MKRKKYGRPFKMFGSYVGAILIPFLSYLIFEYQSRHGTFAGVEEMAVVIMAILGIFFLVPIGFIIGWAVQVLLSEKK